MDKVLIETEIPLIPLPLRSSLPVHHLLAHGPLLLLGAPWATGGPVVQNIKEQKTLQAFKTGDYVLKIPASPALEAGGPLMSVKDLANLKGDPRDYSTKSIFLLDSYEK